MYSNLSNLTTITRCNLLAPTDELFPRAKYRTSALLGLCPLKCLIMISSIYYKQGFWRHCYCTSKAAEFGLGDSKKEDLLSVDK